MNHYEIATFPRGLQYIAAIAMTAISIGLLVVLPAKMESGSRDVDARAASNTARTTPAAGVISQPRAIVIQREQTITQASSGAASATRVQ